MKIELMIALLLLFFAVSFAAAQQTVLPFTVLEENGRAFRDLKAADIQLRQGKNLIPIGYLDTKADFSVEMVIMIDISVSQERSIENEKKAAIYIIENLLRKGTDKAAIASFAVKVTFEQEMTDDFASAQRAVGPLEIEVPPNYVGGGVVAGIPPKGIGQTSLWDSVREVVDKAAIARSPGARRVIVLISDGVNTAGDKKMKEAVEASLRNAVSVFALGIGDDMFGGIDGRNLRKLTDQTNGITIIPNKKLSNLPDLVRKLEESLRFTYELKFDAQRVSDPRTLQETRIEIVNPELKKRRLNVVQPKGYFPSN